ITLGLHPAIPLLGLGHFSLGLMKAFHFAAYIGAVALVNIHEAQHFAIPQGSRHTRSYFTRQVGTLLMVEVHRQKRPIAGNVDVTKSIIKLDTIINRKSLRSQMN